jgi:hypothetical protein
MSTARTCLYFPDWAQSNAGSPPLTYIHMSAPNQTFSLHSHNLLITILILIHNHSPATRLQHVQPPPPTGARLHSVRHRQVRCQMCGRPCLLLTLYRLKGIPVPPKIKCGRCQKNLPPTKYSTKQLTDLRYQIHHTGRQTGAINCQPCTGQQIVEIECTVCHKTQGLEAFARSQRSKPDDAVRPTLCSDPLILMMTQRCFKCTDDLVSHQPVNEDRYNGTRSAFVTPDTYDGYMPDYWSSVDSSAGSTTIVSIPDQLTCPKS